MLNSYDLPAMLYYKGTIFNSKLLVITRGYGLYQTKQHGDSWTSNQNLEWDRM